MLKNSPSTSDGYPSTCSFWANSLAPPMTPGKTFSNRRSFDFDTADSVRLSNVAICAFEK